MVLVFACFFSVARAAASITAPPAPLPSETLLVDTRSLVMDKGQWTMLSEADRQVNELRRRASAAPSVATTFDLSVSSTMDQASSSATASSTSLFTPPPSPLPSPFDMSMGSNFTGNNGNGACPAFINSFLTNPTFRECYPFSMLMQVRYYPVQALFATYHTDKT